MAGPQHHTDPLTKAGIRAGHDRGGRQTLRHLMREVRAGQNRERATRGYVADHFQRKQMRLRFDTLRADDDRPPLAAEPQKRGTEVLRRNDPQQQVGSSGIS